MPVTRHIKIEEITGEELEIHIVADPTTLAELQNVILIEAQKRGITYVPKYYDPKD